MTVGDLLGIQSPSKEVYGLFGCEEESIKPPEVYQYKSVLYGDWRDCIDYSDMQKYKKHEYETRIKPQE